MDVFRAGESLLRHPQSFLPFLSSRTCRPTNAFIRTATQTCRFNATSSKADGESERKSTTKDILSSIFDNPAEPQVRKTSPASQYDSFQGHRPEKSTSVDDILAMVTQETQNRNGRAGGFGSTILTKDLDDTLDHALPNIPEPQLPFKLGPSVGRMVFVDSDRNLDVARAFTILGQKCARNQVKRDFNKQRFHERPGLKRKRLKSERWRAQFKEGFRGILQRTRQLKKQGW